MAEDTTPKAHKWGEVDFSRVAAAEIPNVLNMFNQRLAAIEDNTYARDENGKILADKDGNPLTLTNFYVLKAEQEHAAAIAAAEAKKEKENK